MLLELFAVLIPLAVGACALYAAATGSFDLDETVALAPRQRLVQSIIAVVAFGLAGYAYSHLGTVDMADHASPVTPAAGPPEAHGEAAIAVVGRAASATIETAAGTKAGETREATAPTSDAAPSLTAAAVTNASVPSGALSQSAQQFNTEWRRPTDSPPAPAIPATAPATPPASPPRAPAAQEVATATAAPADKKKAARDDSSVISDRDWPEAARRRGARLAIQISDRLGAQQSAEQLTLAIEGLRVAQLSVDTAQPAHTLTVPLPRAGLVHYRLSGHSDGVESQVLFGEGCIRLRDGARFAIRRPAHSNRVYLEPVRD